MAAATKRTKRKRKKDRKRTETDALRGVVTVRLSDGSLRYRASIPGGRRGSKTWTKLVDTAELAAELRKRTIQKLGDLPVRTLTFDEAIKGTQTDLGQRCRPATLKWFNQQVPAMQAFFGKMLVAGIKPQDIERFAAQQRRTGVADGTVLHRRRGLRCVLSQAADQLVHGDPMKRVRRGTWPKLRKGKVTAPEPDAIRTFLAKTLASGSPRARQDYDIVAVLYLTGLRLSELARLRAEDLRPDEGRIFVQGKNRDEWLPVNAEAMTVLQRMSVRVNGEGALVPGGTEEIKRVLKQRSLRNGIKLSPHMLRRAFVTQLVRAGHDVATVARYSRHTSDEIQRYMAANEDDRRVLAAVSIEAPKKRAGKTKGKAKRRSRPKRVHRMRVVG